MTGKASAPSVGIVIPVYNGASYLGCAIDSVVAQTTADWELIVVDDGSNDESGQVAEHFARQDHRIRVLHCSHHGVAMARNVGFSALSPEVKEVVFLDADDVLEPAALSILQGALRSQTHRVGAHGLARYIDAQGRSIRPGEAEAWTRNRRGIVRRHLIRWPRAAPTTLAVLVVANYVMTPGTMLIRRDALDAVGGFTRTFSAAADWDCWLRLSAHGDIAFVDQVIVAYRQHGRHLSRNAKGMAEEGRAVRRQFIASRQRTAPERQIALLGSRWANWVDAELWAGWLVTSVAHRHWQTAARQLLRTVLAFIRFSATFVAPRLS